MSLCLLKDWSSRWSNNVKGIGYRPLRIMKTRQIRRVRFTVLLVSGPKKEKFKNSTFKKGKSRRWLLRPFLDKFGRE